MDIREKLGPEKKNTMPAPMIKEENDPVDVIDLDEYKTLEEISIEWNIRVLNYFKYFFCEDTERSLSSVMRWYIQTLKEDAVDQLDDKIMKHAMEKHILYCKLYFKEIDCSFYDNYLDNMEEILAIYCDLKVRTLPKKQGKDPTTFKNELISICRKLILLLRIYLFGHDYCVLHVLMRMKLYTETEESRDFFNMMFGYFMNRKPKNKSDLSFCRIYILCQKWKQIRPMSEWTGMDDQMYSIYSRTSDSLRSNNVLRRILLPQHDSVLDILAHVNNNYQVLMQQYFDFMHSSDATDLEEMQALTVSSVDGDIELDIADEDEDENFQRAFSQYVRSLDDVKLEIIGETIVLSDDDDEDDDNNYQKTSSKNEVKDENESDDEIEFFVTNTIESDDDEICFEPVAPVELQSNSFKKSSTVSTSTTDAIIICSSPQQLNKSYTIPDEPKSPQTARSDDIPQPEHQAFKKIAVTIATQTDEDLCQDLEEEQRNTEATHEDYVADISSRTKNNTDTQLNNNDKETQIQLEVVASINNNELEDIEGESDSTKEQQQQLVVALPDAAKETANIVESTETIMDTSSQNVDVTEVTTPRIPTQTTTEDDLGNNMEEQQLPMPESTHDNSSISDVGTNDTQLNNNNDNVAPETPHGINNEHMEIDDPKESAGSSEEGLNDDDAVPTSSNTDDNNVERSSTDKIMFTSPTKIDRIISHRDFCQFEEFVNKSNVFDEILSGPLVERMSSLTCPQVPVDNSLDIFANDNIANNNVPSTINDVPLSPVDHNVTATSSSSGFVSPAYEEGLGDFNLDEVQATVVSSTTPSTSGLVVRDDENRDPDETTNDEPLSTPNLHLSKNPQPVTTPVPPRKQKVLVFGKDEYDDDNQRRPVRPPKNGPRQLKSILRTRKELYISVKKLTPAELSQWERVSELSKRVREMKMMKAGISGQEVVKKLYLEKFRNGKETGPRKICIPFAPWRPPDENNSKKSNGKGRKVNEITVSKPVEKKEEPHVKEVVVSNILCDMKCCQGIVSSVEVMKISNIHSAKRCLRSSKSKFPIPNPFRVRFDGIKGKRGKRTNKMKKQVHQHIFKKPPAEDSPSLDLNITQLTDALGPLSVLPTSTAVFQQDSNEQLKQDNPTTRVPPGIEEFECVMRNQIITAASSSTSSTIPPDLSNLTITNLSPSPSPNFFNAQEETVTHSMISECLAHMEKLDKRDEQINQTKDAATISTGAVSGDVNNDNNNDDNASGQSFCALSLQSFLHSFNPNDFDLINTNNSQDLPDTMINQHGYEENQMNDDDTTAATAAALTIQDVNALITVTEDHNNTNPIGYTFTVMEDMNSVDAIISNVQNITNVEYVQSGDANNVNKMIDPIQYNNMNVDIASHIYSGVSETNENNLISTLNCNTNISTKDNSNVVSYGGIMNQTANPTHYEGNLTITYNNVSLQQPYIVQNVANTITAPVGPLKVTVNDNENVNHITSIDSLKSLVYYAEHADNNTKNDSSPNDDAVANPNTKPNKNDDINVIQGCIAEQHSKNIDVNVQCARMEQLVPNINVKTDNVQAINYTKSVISSLPAEKPPNGKKHPAPTKRARSTRKNRSSLNNQTPLSSMNVSSMLDIKKCPENINSTTNILSEDGSGGVETRLPLKKRKLSVANCTDDYDDEDEDFLEPNLVEDIIKRARCESDESDISYPADRMISIAEVQEKLCKEQQRQFRTPAEKKEMPHVIPPTMPPPFVPSPSLGVNPLLRTAATAGAGHLQMPIMSPVAPMSNLYPPKIPPSMMGPPPMMPTGIPMYTPKMENMSQNFEHKPPNMEHLLPPCTENIPPSNKSTYEAPKIVTEQYNNHTYNNPTINYHMNNLPGCFFPCAASLPYFSPIILPMSGTTTFDMNVRPSNSSTRHPNEAPSSRPKRKRKTAAGERAKTDEN